ncbi:MAG: hypothetical protein A2275_10415 [Bacteroidetes bacterium RIFOXYA12_FULL_35_11]|nr:MAG: hypothetical protein A2X01_18690 [Bacteroidetes bacterium GWF2_35_48]OFY75474.1 MAG: hypothetical protein A2275_10415 [Bacteroidetes bacterium RIFOXYA12_FULL_35_11]OFY96799.1 MAG: hypothetical protein A2491_15910 [Bacteroidetes bacterium RIFOXYC12_FULL_35_7]HBX53339.1 hypothetical protein [Bacteroidales bacterium]
MEPEKIKALINLLDDPNEEIFTTVKQTLLDEGVEAIPELEKAWDLSQELVLQSRIEDIIRNIQLKIIKNNFSVWAHSEKNDLLEGVYLIAKYQYPDLRFEDVREKIEIVKKDVWLELNENLTALEKVKILNHIIFDIHKFSLNNANFYSPQNSYINIVLETKKGNPLSLSIIYALIAQSLGLPIYGVNLPKNFILAYKEEISALFAFEEESEAVLFYINPSNKGAVFGRKEIDYFLKQQKLSPEKSFYVPCSNAEIIIRLINNLIASYEKLSYNDKVSDLEEILTVLKSI